MRGRGPQGDPPAGPAAWTGRGGPAAAGSPGARGQLAALLRAYLLMSVRARGLGGRRDAARLRGLWAMAFGYALAGVAMGVIGLGHPDVFTFSTLVHSGTLMMALAITGVVAGDVIFSREEAEVIGFRPVPPSLLLLAKAINLAAIAALVGLVFNLAPCVLGLQAAGARWWFPAAHALTSVLVAAFAGAAQVFLYALMARVVPRERLERGAAIAQAVITVAMILAWQIVPRMTEDVAALRLADRLPWIALAPPAWFGALDAVLAGSRPTPALGALALVGLGATGLLGWLAVRRLAPALEEPMVRPPAAAARRAVAEPRARGTGRRSRPAPRRGGSLGGALGIWLRDPVERGAFRLALAYLRRDRELTMRLLPTLAPVVAMVIIAALQRESSMVNTYLMLGVFWLALIPATTLGLLEVSSHAAAAEVFRVAPLANPAALFHGARKAVLLCVVLPGYLLVAVLAIVLLRGSQLALAACLPPLLLTPVLELLPASSTAWLPLSRDPQRGLEGGMSAGRMMLSFALVLPFAMLGLFASRTSLMPALLAGELVAVLVARTLLLRRVRARARIEPAD